MIFQICYIVLLTLIAHTIHGTQDVKSAQEVARIQAHIDQKSNFLATLGTVLPRIQLQRLVLEYSKKPHLTPLVIPTFSSSPAVANAQSDTCYATAVPAASAGNAARALSMLPAQVSAPPASKRMTANASHHVTVAAPGAAADAAEGQTEPFAKDWREYTVSNIIALPNRGFALRRSTAIQTWQLQADNTARKGAIEHKTQRDTHYIHLTPLHDGTILSKIVAGSKWRNGVHHWNPYTNATSNALSADWKMRFPNQNGFISMALPLSTGKILLFFKDCSKVFWAENAKALDKKLKRSRALLPPILNGTVLAGDTVVLFHQDVAAVFDSVSLMRNPNQRQRKRKDFSRDPVPEYVAPLAAPIREVAKVDDRSFVTWGDLNGDASRSFVEVWRLTGHLLQRVHRLTSNEPILDAAIADGRCIAISKPLHQNRTIQVRALAHGARWENVPHSADASSLTTLSDGTVLVANYDGSIHRVNNPDEFLEQLARTQQKNVGNNCKDLKAQSELMLAPSHSIEDQKEQALVCMNNFLPSALLPLTLCYEDSTLLDTIIPPPAAPITSNNSPATPVGAAAAGAGQSAVISSPAPIALENYVTIVPLSNGEFALHNTNNNTVQTWQLQHDGSAKKNEHEYTMDQKEERRRLIPLPDGTLLTNIGETGFLHHWNPKTNSAHSYNTGWTRSNDRKLILPLDNGKILIYSQSGYGGIQSAESVSALDKELKPGKKGFLASDGIVLSDENVVFYAGEQLAIYDSAELIEENNDKPPKYTAHIEKAITHIAKIDKNSFLTWTYYDEQRLKNPCIEIWRIHHDELERIHQIKFLPAMIVSAFVVKNKCYAMDHAGNTYEWDLATGTQWQKIPNDLPVTSINVLTDGTVLMARKDGSVCKAHPSTGLAGDLASKQQEKQLRKTLMAELKAKAPKIMAGTLLKKRAH